MWGPVNGENAALGWPQQPLEKNLKKGAADIKTSPDRLTLAAIFGVFAPFFQFLILRSFTFTPQSSPLPLPLIQLPLLSALSLRWSFAGVSTLAKAET